MPNNPKIQYKQNRNAISGLIVLSLLLAAFLAVPSSHAAIRTVTGTVTKVSDGDTIQVLTPEQTKLKVRLYGIDAPETAKISRSAGHARQPGQPYGDESWKVLESKIKGRQVKLDILDIDKYRRMVGMIWLDGRNINLEMVREGHAEAFIEYLKEPYRSEFFKAEREARSAKKGIWSLPEYERPREFRKRLKSGANNKGRQLNEQETLHGSSRPNTGRPLQ